MSLLTSMGAVRPCDVFLDHPWLRTPAPRNDSFSFSSVQGLCVSNMQQPLSYAADLQGLGSAARGKAFKRSAGLLHGNSEFLGHGIHAICEAHSLSFKEQGHIEYYGVGAAECGKSEKGGKQAKKASRKLGKRSAAGGMLLETEVLSENQGEVAVEMDEKAMLRQVLKELQKVTSELKSLRKAQEKAAKCDSSSSSSSSSESSGSDMEAEDMRNTRANREMPLQQQQVTGGMQMQRVSPASALPEPDAFAAELRAFVEKGSIHPQGSSLPSVCGDNTLHTVAALGSEMAAAVATMVGRGGSVEVCMSGKCRRDHGAQQLLSAFQSSTAAQVGISASSCKCLGKCGKGANVRVRPDETNPTVLSYVEPQDVQSILSRHFGTAPSGRPVPSFKQPALQTTTAAVS